MDGTFSISLKKKGKGKKKKTINVFGNDDTVKNKNGNTSESHITKKRKIRLTELNAEDFAPPEVISGKSNEPELVIKMEETLSDKNEQIQKVTTLEEYDNVPVESFGEALLRGMGWDGKIDDNEKKPKQNVEDIKKEMLKAKHPDNLGIGATATGIEIDTTSFMPIKQVEVVNQDKK